MSIVFNRAPLQSPTVGTAILSTTSFTSILVPFTQPSDDGGVPIQYYVATATPGGKTATVTQSGSGTITVTGLTSGQTYNFSVSAYNWFGLGPVSSTSNCVVVATIPCAPTGISASVASVSSIKISYSAPANNGGATITRYVATSSPGGFTGTLSQSGSGTITVSGLSSNTVYSFTVKATNIIGNSSPSASTNMSIVVGSQTYPSAGHTTPGSYTWIAPSYVNSVSVVAIGGGGSGSASGGCSYFINSSTVLGGGGGVGTGGTHSFTGCGGGGNGGAGASGSYGKGGGGAGGYSSAGGAGGNTLGSCSGSGGGGGGGSGFCYLASAGGGVGVYGQGSNGAGVNSASGFGSCQYIIQGGGGGSCGGQGGGYSTYPRYTYNGANGGGSIICGVAYGGGLYGGSGKGSGGGGFGGGGSVAFVSGGSAGGGGGLAWRNNIAVSPGTSYNVFFGAGGSGCGAGGCGAVRIVWPGTFRTFPSTCVGTP